MTDSNVVRAEQAAILAVVAAKVRDGFANIHPTDPAQSFPALAALAATLTNRYGAAAATQATQHYMEARSAAGVVGSYRPVPASPAPLQQVTGMTGWAVRGLQTSRAPIIGAGTPEQLLGSPQPPTEEAIRAAERDLVAGVERLVLEQARKTTVENVQRDRKARGWAREAKPNCCAFCGLMASRGAVYHSEGTAGRNANDQFTGSGLFKWHNGCSCVIVPDFGTFQLSPTALAAAEAYKNRGKGDALNAFRRTWEDRNRPEGFKPRIPR